ncbi:MAG: right-handed parallel beta-helix repeat-containing protein, partial [Deltaproteobacteria bacterium]|nr:right-handed parallel beta-helix repeat-containing protein [Deltaproteobacteria bacterium]
PILETATGLSLVTGADNAMSWYPDDNSLWCADRFPKNIIKLFGTDAELDGYDASGASSTNHLRIGGFVGEAFSVSVYPGDGMGVSGHVWAADRLSVIIKFSANGSEVLRREPTGFYEARDLSVDVSDGSVWVMDPNNDRIAKYSPEGDELVNKGFAYTRTIEADPFDGGAWLGLSEGLVKLSASGAVEWTRTTSTVDAIALPSQVNKKVTIYVSNGGSDTDGSGSKENPFRTIEKAITQAKYGDTVVVEAGIYNRNVSLKSGIRVIGAGADVTMIQGPGTGNVVEGISIQNATISGFTITGAADFNSIISCIDCNGIIIRENIITGNGMLSYRGDNGIVLQEKTQALVERNVITGNTSDGIFLANTVQAIIRNNIIANNGVGIFRGSGSLTSYIINNVIDSNGKPEYSGRSGIMIIGIEGIEDNDVIKNNIVSNNGYNNPNPGLSVGIYVGGGATPELSYNNVYNNYQGEYTGVAPGTGDISADPLYVDLASGDYHLKSGSPSENTGDPALYDADIDCSAFPACRSDMGAYGGPWKNPLAASPPGGLIIISS